MTVEGVDDRAEAKIDFGGEYGVKHLVLRYAPLEKLYLNYPRCRYAAG